MQCLSPNGLVLNGRFLGPDSGEQRCHGVRISFEMVARIQDRDALALATCRAYDAEPLQVSEASAATAALWTVPTPKPFLIFEFEAQNVSLGQEEHGIRCQACSGRGRSYPRRPKSVAFRGFGEVEAALEELERLRAPVSGPKRLRKHGTKRFGRVDAGAAGTCEAGVE